MLLHRCAELCKVSKDVVEELIKVILIEKPDLGEYKELEQVFIKSIGTDKIFAELLNKPISFAKYYTCFYCGQPIDKKDKNCSSCEKEVIYCSVCKLNINFADLVGQCTLCESKGHLSHLQEWLKIKGKCPNCLQELPIEGIMTLERETKDKE